MKEVNDNPILGGGLRTCKVCGALIRGSTVCHHTEMVQESKQKEGMKEKIAAETKEPMLSDAEIEKAVKEIGKKSTAPDKETPLWMETDIRQGLLYARDFYESRLREKWISCEERLPEQHKYANFTASGSVLIFTDTYTIIKAHLLNGLWVEVCGGETQSFKPVNAYYWMPLPSPPLVKGENK